MKTRIRQQLLDAAAPLAAQMHYDELSIARLCAAAGVSSNDFKSTFGDLSTYFDVLQVQFLDGLRTRMLKVTSGIAPGLLRIKLASESYLAYCLEAIALRRWLLASRAHPSVLRTFRQQNLNYTLLLGAELRAANCEDADAVARLYLAMLNEIASFELRCGTRQTTHREALWHFLDHAGLAVQEQRNAA